MKCLKARSASCLQPTTSFSPSTQRNTLAVDATMTPTVEAAMRDATMEEPAEDSSPDNSPRRLRRGPPPYIDMEAILDGLRERALADGKTVKPRLNRDTGE